MKNKVIKTIIKSIIIFVILILNISNSYGAQGSMYLGLRGKSTARATGTYTFNNKPVFKIIKYNSSGTAAEDGTSIYCLKGGPGFGSEAYQTNVIEYTQYFDIKSPSSITPAAYRNQLPSDTTTYSQLVWVLDHIYTPAKNGASSAEIALANQSKQDLLRGAGVEDSSLWNELSTNEFNDIIETIQQVAIWYFTNTDGYHNTYKDTVTIKVDGTDLIDKYGLNIVSSEIDAIYSYLVNGAINAVKAGYSYENSTQNPLKINSSSVTATIEGNNYIVGPYKIEKNINSEYTLNASITDGSNQISSAKILNQSKQEITSGTNISQKIQSTIGNNFYISVPVTSGVSKVKLQINGSANVIKQTLWTVGENNLGVNQPVAIVERTSQSYTDSHEINTPQITGRYALKIVKKDSSNSNNLQGAKFTVKINNGTATEYTTNASGEINIPTIQITSVGEDIVTINETQAPSGYVPNSSNTTIKVTKAIQNGKYVATAVEGTGSNLTTDSSGVNTVNYTAYNSKIVGAYKIKLLKQDSANRDKLAGAKFNISINGGRAQEYTTNADGEIAIDNVAINSEGEDTIEIQETQAPSGYKLDSNKITLKVTKTIVNNKYVATNVTGSENANLTQDASTGVNTVNIIVNNEKISDSYNLKIVKKDADNESKKLENAKFRVTFYRQNSTESNEVEETAEYTTNSQGEINISKAIVAGNLIGKIKIEEIEAPVGYEKLLNNEITLRFRTVEANNKYSITDITDINNNGNMTFNRETNTIEVNVTNKRLNFDLALRKFITKINNKSVEISREPQIGSDEINKLANEEATFDDGTTALKTHTKKPLPVETGDKVLYTIRIYNEGSLDGYAKEITDYLPDGLELVPSSDSAINTKYGWKVDANNSKKITTNYLQNQVISKVSTTNLSYRDVEIECKVVKEAGQDNISLKNVAEITSAEDINGNTNDIDSVPNDLTDNQKTSYNPGTSERGKGYEDDDDYEELVLQKKHFDLALRKFITKINNKSVEVSREPQIENGEISKLASGDATFDDGTTSEKTHTKKPLLVETGDKVLYTIRIYNEGGLDGYAKEITDYLPDGLELVPSSDSTINTKYGWKADTSNSKKITTNYLQNQVISKVSSTNLSYRDVEIECKVVKEAGQDSVSLKNVAEITRAEDINGNTNDIDSVPNDLTDNQKNSYNPGTSERGKGYEDDDDYEELILTGKYFDLALRKFITKINDKSVEISREPQIENSEINKLANEGATFDNGTTAQKTHTKKPLSVETGDKVLYTIRIYNEGSLDGYAKEITDYLPDGLELVPSSDSTINTKYGWKADANNSKKITTNYLQNQVISKVTSTRLSYRDVEVECRVVKEAGQDNVSLKNVAEITRAEDINGNAKDIDSVPNDLTDNQKNSYNPETSERGKGYEDDDDYEELILSGKYFDLALRKFITGVNDKNITSREPVVDVTPLLNGETTAHYNHSKEPVEVDANDIVTYTIRVYNEGTVDGYVNKIVDHLPPELEFLPNDSINKQYGWKQTNERTIETEYLKNTLIKAFNMTGTLDYKDVKIRCRVKETSELLKKITNIAEITDYRNNPNIPDRDNENKVELPKDEDLPDYKKEDIESGKEYIPGQEDDDDFEKVVLKKFDLALRKFITGVNNDEVTSRIPQVDTSKYGQKREDGTIITSFEYNHTKDPVRVSHNDIVTYTIRIYNEGTKSGYAQEIKDDIPDGLTFLIDNETNKQYRWKMYDEDGNETYDTAKATHIRTDYLSIENEKTKGENLLKAYNAQTMEEPDYRDVKVAFRVAEPNTSDRIIINKAEISEDADENGDDVPDIDSTPDEWIEGEDDQDIEKIYVQYFDLALRKWVTQVVVIEDGVEKVKETGHYAEQDPEPVVRVDLNQKRIDNTIIKFRYKIRIANEGEIPGYATEISDYIPKGLSFNQADNPLWKEVDGKIVTDQLKDTLLNPGETATVEITLTWINDEENMGVMTNVAEISKDKNDSNTPDIDSTPNNKKEGEDDIDDAPVALTMVTGKAPTYIAITSGISAIIAGGVFLIKKYVI